MIWLTFLVLLDGLDGYQLSCKRDLFDLYFENFVYKTGVEGEKGNDYR